MDNDPFSSGASPAARRLQESQKGPVQIIAFGLIGAGLLAFVLQNTASTRVRWLFFDGDAPLWIVLLMTVVLTAAAVEIGERYLRRRKARKPKALGAAEEG